MKNMKSREYVVSEYGMPRFSAYNPAYILSQIEDADWECGRDSIKVYDTVSGDFYSVEDFKNVYERRGY